MPKRYPKKRIVPDELRRVCSIHGDTHVYTKGHTYNNCAKCHRKYYQEYYKKNKNDQKFLRRFCPMHECETWHYGRTMNRQCVMCKQLYDASRHATVTITPKDQLDILVSQGDTCGICGDAFSYDDNTTKALWAPSWDRLDVKGDYTRENVQATHWICNKNRGNFTMEQFKEWIGKVNSKINT